MKNSTYRTPLLRAAGAAAVIALLLTGLAPAAPAQSVAGTYLEIEIESGGQTQLMKLSLGPDRLRMDTGQDVSFVSIGGDDGKMLMIQHGEKIYMELTAEMMASFAAMMGQMPPDVEQEMEEDTTPPTFTRTGNTKQVGEWSAYEVRVTHPEQQDEMTMWFSQDVDADIQGIAEQVMDSLSSLLDNPMLRGMGGMGGGGGAGVFDSVQRDFRSLNMPDGFPVQVISNEDGTRSTNTLKAIDQGASFGPETWTAPEGYQKMQMPMIRH
jgi:hypothetical protein